MFEYTDAVVVIAVMLRHFSKAFRFNLGDGMFICEGAVNEFIQEN